MLQPVLTVAEMQEVDARAVASTPLEELVERAGTAVAVAALDLLGGAYGRRVVLICGKGNNGADGRVAARLLSRRGARVAVVAPGAIDAIGFAGPRVDLVVDAAFGTGFRGTLRRPAGGPRHPGPGRRHPLGGRGRHRPAAGSVLPADATVTFVALKPGLVQGDGARAGRRGPGGRHRAARRRAPTIAVVDDADVADAGPGAAPRAATSGRPPCWWWPARRA